MTSKISPYQCSLNYFTIGYADWLKEKVGAKSSTALQSSDSAASSKNIFFKVMVGAVVLMLLTAFVVSLLAPFIVQGMSAVGASAIASASRFLQIAIGVLLIVGLPLWAGTSLLKFSKQTCYRGYLLKTGARKPYRF